jgi:hypothetical protein
MLFQAEIVEGAARRSITIGLRSGHSWRTGFTDVRVGGGVATRLAAADL